jgi:hypothetical protein
MTVDRRLKNILLVLPLATFLTPPQIRPCSDRQFAGTAVSGTKAKPGVLSLAEAATGKPWV